MTDSFELDFLDVESKKSGDAIAMRYTIDGITTIHVVDGGYQDTGEKLVTHINKYYDSPNYINHVVATHSDGDHAGGLRHILESHEIGELWMLRPWLYAEELLPRFENYNSIPHLEGRLRKIYPHIAALEEIAINNNITIREPFQGEQIGAFTVMTPSRSRFFDLVVNSEKTPESANDEKAEAGTLFEMAKAILKKLAEWGSEKFSTQETSAENEMSIVQYASIADEKILLTGDTGRAGLTEAADYAPYIGLTLPGIDRFQVPHHGSRRNVSTETLNRWLGDILPTKPSKGEETFTALISAAKLDKDHPRNAVVRAMVHRGAKTISTEGGDKRTSKNAPDREGWVAVTPLEYPEEQEDD